MNTSKKAIELFFKENGIDTIYLDFLEESNEILNNKENNYNSEKLISDISNILIDGYKLNSETIKNVTEKLAQLNIRIGRVQKDLLLEYYNYNNIESKKAFIQLILKKQVKKEVIEEIIDEYRVDFSKEAVSRYIADVEYSIKNNDQKKTNDYILAIYSKLLLKYDKKEIKLIEIFNENYKMAKDELSTESFDELEDFASSQTDLKMIEEQAKLFHNYYVDLLIKDGRKINQDIKYNIKTNLSIPTETYDSIFFTISQEYLNKFDTLENFYFDIADNLVKIYKTLKNYKTLIVKIDDIHFNELNIKWEVHSIIGIISDKLIKATESKNYYKPEEIVIDFISDIYNFDEILRDQLISEFKLYYKTNNSVSSLHDLLTVNNIPIDYVLELLNEFREIEIGFNYNDSIILEKSTTNGEYTELLYIYYKYEIDDRKIPCPTCGSLKVSGNSFPDIWHRSWECKNIYCPDRSKSNRGKRFSVKTSYMQYGFMSDDSINLIPDNMIKQWRRDVVKIQSNQEVLDMVIKYFTFSNEKLLLINFNQDIAIKTHNRTVDSIYLEKASYQGQMNESNPYYRILLSENSRLNKFVFNSTKESLKTKCKYIIGESSILINGDSSSELYGFNEEIIDSAVTSPPYYNARMYSQWANYYLYLRDMYRNAKAVSHVIKKDGVYLYNVGDVQGNENIIVKSMMGNKKILLGPYSYWIFKKAGFNLLDCIIWDKGEVQSNRQMNDGKFTPHYQKPMNSYEYMYLFTKESNDLLVEKTKNIPLIMRFTPVIKINSKGVNTLGHTAPFPSTIPNIIIDNYTDSNDSVLDPFSGSLTTVITAAENNRIGIGIELSKEYYDLSIERALAGNIKLNI